MSDQCDTLGLENRDSHVFSKILESMAALFDDVSLISWSQPRIVVFWLLSVSYFICSISREENELEKIIKEFDKMELLQYVGKEQKQAEV